MVFVIKGKGVQECGDAIARKARKMNAGGRRVRSWRRDPKANPFSIPGHKRAGIQWTALAVGTIVIVARIRALSSNVRGYALAYRAVAFAVRSFALPISSQPIHRQHLVTPASKRC